MNRLFSSVIFSSVIVAAGCVAGDASGTKAESTLVTSSVSMSPSEYVNPLMGGDSNVELSHGNNYPAIARPWGMNFWTPQSLSNYNWFYTYHSNKIRGIRQTHMPSPWIGDYGAFSLFAETGDLKIGGDQRASWFSHKSEIAKPNYYSVYLADYDVTAEATPTERAAMFRFTFPESKASHILIDTLDQGNSHIKLIPHENKVIGYTSNRARNYFVVVFDKPFAESQVWRGGGVLAGVTEQQGNSLGAAVTFATQKGDVVHARVASSFISFEQAELNLKELGTDSFDQIREKGKAIWDKELSRVLVEGGTTDQTRTFYTCLYRTMLFPRKFFEIDAQGKVVHFSPYNGKVLPGHMFTDTGFWDTFRAVFPLFNLMHPSLNANIQEGLVNAYKESGWLPEWASPGHADCMIGNNAVSVVADAYLKGGRGYDINALYEAALHESENSGPMRSVGRCGVNYYNSLGYIPYDAGINENTARTLEYAYDDWCNYRLAKALKRPQEEIDRFAKRCQNYRNVFDPETKLMRGRNKDGSFQKPFNPYKWGDAFTEGNSMHYTWSVFHDIQGLIDLMGGKKAFVEKLDGVFTAPPVFDASYYGREIHEILEMRIAGMGNYAHGNQPIQHMIYLYNYAGEPWKTQYWVRETMDRLYSPTPDGYCGDEDNGQTSAWYVFSAMGFYPVCPGSDQYVLGAPLFKKITLSLENGKKIVINAPENSGRNRYVKGLKVNGKPYSKNWVGFDALMKGAILDFAMDDKPDTGRGINPEDAPYSFSTSR